MGIVLGLLIKCFILKDWFHQSRAFLYRVSSTHKRHFHYEKVAPGLELIVGSESREEMPVPFGDPSWSLRRQYS